MYLRDPQGAARTYRATTSMHGFGDGELGTPAGGTDYGNMGVPDAPTVTAPATTSSSGGVWDSIANFFGGVNKGLAVPGAPMPGTVLIPPQSDNTMTFVLLGGVGLVAFMMLRKKKDPA